MIIKVLDGSVGCALPKIMINSSEYILISHLASPKHIYFLIYAFKSILYAKSSLQPLPVVDTFKND